MIRLARDGISYEMHCTRACLADAIKSSGRDRGRWRDSKRERKKGGIIESSGMPRRSEYRERMSAAAMRSMIFIQVTNHLCSLECWVWQW